MSLEKQALIEENLQKLFNDESFKEMLSAEDFDLSQPTSARDIKRDRPTISFIR